MLRGWAVVIAVVAGLAGMVRAGARWPSPVSVVVGSYAAGALGSARNSGDQVQYIGCQQWTTTSVYCLARDAAGTSISCWTNDPTLVTWAQSLNSDSYLYFAVNSGGYCTVIAVENSSAYEPKQP